MPLRGAILAAESAAVDERLVSAAKCLFFDLSQSKWDTAQRPWPRWQYHASGKWLDLTREIARELDRRYATMLVNPQEDSVVSMVPHGFAHAFCLERMEQRNVLRGFRSCKICKQPLSGD